MPNKSPVSPGVPGVAKRPVLTVSACVNEADFARLETAWEALHAAGNHSGFFLSFDWMFHWWQFYKARIPHASLLILTARDETDRLVGILPLFGRRSGRFPLQFRALHFLGTQFEAPEHLDVLVPPHLASVVVPELVQFLLDRIAPAYDALVLTDLAEDACLTAALSAHARQNGLASWLTPWMVCPFVQIQGPFAEYLQQRSGNTRYNLRRRTRQLQRDFRTGFSVVRSADELPVGMNALMDLHQKRWAEHRETSTFNNAASRQFHRELARRLAEKDRVRLFLLRSNGVPVAALFGYLQNRRFYYYQAGFDPTFQQYSVGMVLMGKILEYCFRKKYVEFDFLRGQEPYKFKWTEKTRQTWCLEVALTRRARHYFQLKHRVGRIKLRLRKIWQSVMPDA